VRPIHGRDYHDCVVDNCVVDNFVVRRSIGDDVVVDHHWNNDAEFGGSFRGLGDVSCGIEKYMNSVAEVLSEGSAGEFWCEPQRRRKSKCCSICACYDDTGRTSN
jgi:hypothetical protein